MTWCTWWWGPALLRWGRGWCLNTHPFPHGFRMSYFKTVRALRMHDGKVTHRKRHRWWTVILLGEHFDNGDLSNNSVHYFRNISSTSCWQSSLQFRFCVYYAPPLIGGGLSDAFIWRLSVSQFHYDCESPFCYVSLGSWVISLTVFGASVANLNEPLRALATSTIASVRS